jgi:hypothetical protein
MIGFLCEHQWSKSRTEKWEGVISEIRTKDNYCEFFIQSRSSIRVFLGFSKLGRYVCIPDWQASCWLSAPEDMSSNKVKLAKAMKNKVDGTTVACAIHKLGDILPW